MKNLGKDIFPAVDPSDFTKKSKPAHRLTMAALLKLSEDDSYNKPLKATVANGHCELVKSLQKQKPIHASDPFDRLAATSL
jgi:hypothetical protein